MLRWLKQWVATASLFFVQATCGGVLYFISGFVPRKRNLWLFGCWEGWRFSGNTKYLFLYTQQHGPGIEAVWITKSEDVYTELREEHLPVVKAFRWRGWWLSSRAQFVLVTHGAVDVNPYVLRGAIVVNLFHATLPIKRMGNDHRCQMPRMQWVHSRLRNPFAFRRPDYACASSPFTAKFTASALGIPLARVWVTGTPRHDYCTGKLRWYQRDVDSFRQFLQGRSYRNLIYYVPTFRHNPLFHLFRFAFDPRALEALLEKTDSVLVVSFHPFDAKKYADFVSASARIVLSHADDVLLLLREASVFMTDYSSLAYDCVLLDRPIIFANFDHDGYMAERPLYFPYDAMTPGPKAGNWPLVLQYLEDILVRGNDRFAVQRSTLRKKIIAHTEGASCARLVEALQSLHHTS